MPPPPAPDKFAGRTLGKFKIEKRLGAGGMGAVYKATDNLGRTVALKLLQAGFSEQPEWIERFRREAEKAAQLTHANVVQVYEFGEVEGHHYLSMQFMPGGSLDAVLAKRGALPPAEAARIVRDATRGLAKAHSRGLIHRDIKPANILLGEDGEVRLGDFGLVKSTKGDDQPLTQTGMVLGTPHYMAPEQCEGLPEVDGRVDIFALGIVLYQCLSNVLPAKGTTPLQIIRYRIEEDPAPLRTIAPQVPQALADLVHACMVRDPDKRLATADELARQLDAWLSASTAAPSNPLAGGPTLGNAPTQLERPVVPTGKLLRVDAGTPDVGVLPEVEGPRQREQAARARATTTQAPPKPASRSWCWLLGCGLLAFVGACFAGMVLAKQHELEQEGIEQQYGGW